MKTLDLDKLKALLVGRPDVAFATVFGSAQDGTVADGSDLDLAVWFDPRPDTNQLADLLTSIADNLGFDNLDLTDLREAEPILAFEAISGRMICKNDKAATADIVSRISREYEDVMWRINHAA